MKIKKLFFSVLALIVLVLKVSSQGQVHVNKEWQNSSGNPTFNPILNPFGLQWSSSIRSTTGGLITVGHTQSSSQGENIHLVKRNADGGVIFDVTYNTSGNKNDYGLAVIENSANGNIYVVGTTDNNGTTNHDAVILRYSSTGALLTHTTYASPSGLNDIGSAVKIHSSVGSLIVGVSSENSTSSYDYRVLKLNLTTLALQLTNTYDFANLIDVPTGIEFSSTGQICLIGASASSATKWDYCMAIFDKNTLASISQTRSNIPGIGFDQPIAFCKDASDNIYITGRSSTDGINYDIRTIKILSNLTTIAWNKSYDGAAALEDAGNSIALDQNGDVIVGGFTTLSNSLKQMQFLKYNGSIGTELWHKERVSENPSGDAYVKSIGFNPANGGIYYAGSEKGLGGKNQVLVGKIKSTGERNWAKVIGNSGFDITPSDLNVSQDGIYVISVLAPGSATYQTTKYTELEIDTTTEYNNGAPYRLKKHLLVRFQQNAVKASKINNKEIVHGTLKDFMDSTALVNLRAATGLNDIDRYKCYKVLPWMTMADSLSISRSGRTVKMMHHYTTFGVLLPGSFPDSTVLSKLLNAGNQVNYAQYNRFLSLHLGANDPEYLNGNSAALKTSTAIANANINIEPAWDLSVGDPNIKVGVFDTGINFTHLDFGTGTFSGSKIVGGYDYQANLPLSTTTSNDIYGHGSAVADKIGALRNNNYGISGIAGGDGANNAGVTIYDMKIFGIGTACNFSLTTFATEQSVYDAIVQGASSSGFGQHIQNHSWGGGPQYGLIMDAFIAAQQNEVVMVASSGNLADATPCTPYEFPSSYKDHMVMKVGANNATGGRAGFSMCGNRLDFIAPGTHDLYSSISRTGTTLTDTIYWPPNPQCKSEIDGTSFGAPHAAGTAALLLSYANNTFMPNGLYPEDVEQLMELSSKDLTVSPYSSGYDSRSGYGRIDAGQTMSNYYYPAYLVQHHTFSVSASTATQVGGVFENTCLRTTMFGQPTGIGKVKRYKISGTNSHTIPTGYTFLKGWELNAGSNLMGVNSSFQSTLAIQCYTLGSLFYETRYLPDATNIITLTITPTGASFEGYIYEIFNPSTNVSLGWYPFGPTGTATFAYSTYLRSQTVGLKEELFTEKSLSVFPNPTDGKLYIQSKLVDIDRIDVEVISMLGSVVFKEQNLYIYNTNSIDLSHLTNGVYFANLKYGNKTQVRKIIISK